MLTHHHDRCDRDGDQIPRRLPELRRYAAALPAHCLDEHGCLIDQLIRFATRIVEDRAHVSGY